MQMLQYDRLNYSHTISHQYKPTSTHDQTLQSDSLRDRTLSAITDVQSLEVMYEMATFIFFSFSKVWEEHFDANG